MFQTWQLEGKSSSRRDASDKRESRGWASIGIIQRGVYDAISTRKGENIGIGMGKRLMIPKKRVNAVYLQVVNILMRPRYLKLVAYILLILSCDGDELVEAINVISRESIKLLDFVPARQKFTHISAFGKRIYFSK